MNRVSKSYHIAERLLILVLAIGKEDYMKPTLQSTFAC